MVQIPVGEKVIIDLWDSKKKKGLVKYIDTTMHLVNGISQFTLKKGDYAIVIKSKESFVSVIPVDEFSELINFKKMQISDYNLLSMKIDNLLHNLAENGSDNGGIFSINELLEILRKTSLKEIIKKENLLKLKNIKQKGYEIFEYAGQIYFSIKLEKKNLDIQRLLKIASEAEKSSLSLAEIVEKTNWPMIRIKRNLNFLIKLGLCKKIDNFREGTRFYFLKSVYD
ncbi:MAG: hypothetical protein ACTSRZ_19460 [Promethearchaeota archaeon]